MSDKFTITAKVMEDLKTVGYMLKDKYDAISFCGYNNIKRYIKNGDVSNARLILDASTAQYLIDLDSTENIPIVRNPMNDTYTIVNRIVDANNVCMGYSIKNASNEVKRVKIKTLWKLAMNNQVKDVKAYIYEDKLVLQGINGFKISDIERIKSN